MYTPNLVSILFYDQPLSIFKFDDVMPTSRIVVQDAVLRMIYKSVKSQKIDMESYFYPIIHLMPICVHDAVSKTQEVLLENTHELSPLVHAIIMWLMLHQ